MISVGVILLEHAGQIRQHFRCSKAQFASVLTLIQDRERAGRVFNAEKIWTFLIGCGYAIDGKAGVEALARILTKATPQLSGQSYIWFESMPISPRKKEGATHVDLGVGAIARRGSTVSGIEFDLLAPSWTCFSEAKWRSDVQPGVRYDLNRNQLARDIENALCFQKSGEYPESVYMSVITPELFPWGDSLLGRKFIEYQNPECLVRDLEACCLKQNDRAGWLYPENLAQRVPALKLVRVTYGDLVRAMPESALSTALHDAWLREIS